MVTVKAYSREFEFLRIRPNTDEYGYNRTRSDVQARIAPHHLTFKHASTTPHRAARRGENRRVIYNFNPCFIYPAAIFIPRQLFRRLRTFSVTALKYRIHPILFIFRKYITIIYIHDLNRRTVCLCAMYPNKQHSFFARTRLQSRELYFPSVCFHSNHNPMIIKMWQSIFMRENQNYIHDKMATLNSECQGYMSSVTDE